MKKRDLILFSILAFSIILNLFLYCKLDKAYNEIDCIISEEISDLQIELEKTEDLLNGSGDNISVYELNYIGKQLYDNCYPIAKKISAHRFLGSKYKSLDLGDFEIVIIDMISMDENLSDDKIEKKAEKLSEILKTFNEINLFTEYNFRKDSLHQLELLQKISILCVEYNEI